MFMYQTTSAEFRQIMLNEIETRWPRWRYSAADENDFYAALKNYTPQEIVAAIQNFRINAVPPTARPTIAGLRRYLPRAKAVCPFTKPKLTEQQYQAGYMSAKVTSAYEAIISGNKGLVEFIRDMDPAAVRQAEEYVRQGQQPTQQKREDEQCGDVMNRF
jgi:hypothetical protein